VRVPSGVAPPAVREATVAVPCWIFTTSARLVVVASGTRHTLASYLSMHPAPDTTASAAHFFTGPLGGPLAPAAPARSRSIVVAAAVPFDRGRMTFSLRGARNTR